MLKKVRAKLSKAPIVTAFLTLASGVALGQFIGLVTTPIVSRLYDAAAFGQYAVFVSSSAIICTISQAGLASAIMVPKDNLEANKVFSAAFLLQTGVSVLVATILIMLSPFFQLFKLPGSYISITALFLLYMILSNTGNLLRIVMNRQGMYRTLFWNSLIGAMATLLITIPVGVFKSSYLGFIFAAIVSTSVCIAQMLRQYNPFVNLKLEDIKYIIVKYKDFIIFQLPANMIGIFSQQLPNQVFSRAFGDSALGCYSMSEKIFGIPSRLIASPISTVYFKTAADYHKNGQHDQLADFTFSMVKKLMLLGAIPLLLLFGFGESLFAFVLGAEWRQAGLIATILGFQYVFSICSLCTSYCRVAVERQKTNFAFSMIHLAVIVMSIGVGIIVSDSLLFVIICFSVGNTLVLIVDMALNFKCLGRNIKKYLLFCAAYISILGCFGLMLRGIF